MTQSSQTVSGRMAREVRWDKGPPSLAITEHWNYDNKDFHGRYFWMGPGPRPIEWASIQAGARRFWGEQLHEAVRHYSHAIGVKMVDEMLSDEANRVTLAEDLDQDGLQVGGITHKRGENDGALIAHALDQMQVSMEVLGATGIFRIEDDTNYLGGAARVGASSATSVVDADCRSWDIPNLWIYNGSVFPTVGGVNPALTIQTITPRTAALIDTLGNQSSM